MPVPDLPPALPSGTATSLEPRAEFDHDALLMFYVRRGLGFPTPPAPRAKPEVDWAVLCDRMWLHRLGGIAWAEIASDYPDMAPSAVEWIRHFRSVTARMNGANLLTMRRVLPRLQEEGIPTLAYKGPVLQQIAYGSVFLRPSSDIDILVSRADFDRAGSVLSGLGYRLAEVCRSLWWKAGLGEQHFRSGDPAGATLDLHHRVQQPGCPLPLGPARFMEQSVLIPVGGQDVRTLSHAHSALLAAMSYVKALHHREPAARYAIDLVALARWKSPQQWREITGEAERQGLRNTLALAVRAAGLLLGQDTLPEPPSPAVLSTTTDADLVRMTLSPHDPALEWPRRRALLHALFDNKLAYPAGLAAMVGSDLLRQVAETNRDRQLRRLRLR